MSKSFTQKKIVLTEKVIHDAGVLIEEDKISAVGKRGEFQVPDHSIVLDMGEKTIAPGLIDQMVHGSHGLKREYRWRKRFDLPK